MPHPLIAWTAPSLPESLGYGTVIHIAVVLCICLHVLRTPRDARTSLLWIFFATVFPFVGAGVSGRRCPNAVSASPCGGWC